MVAGGTGFAPLKSMLRRLLESGVRREVHCYWGARHERDVYEQELVLEWVRRFPQLKFTAVLSEASVAEAAHHRVGWVHDAVLADYTACSGTLRVRWPSSRHLAPTLRVFVDFLAANLFPLRKAKQTEQETAG